MAVEFTELDGSPSVDIKVNDLTVTRSFKVAWEDRNAFVSEILGTYDSVYTNARCHHTMINRFPGKNTGSGSWCSYQYAKVEAHYSTTAIVTVGESFEPSAEFTTMDPTDFHWGAVDGPALAAEEAPGKLLITTDYVMSWKNLATVPAAAMNLIGMVNSAPMNPSAVDPILVNYTFPAQTLLYHPPSISRSWDYLNNRASWDLTYRFTFRPNWNEDTPNNWVAKGWNWVYRAATGKYEQIYSATTGEVVLIYPLGAFANLWVQV